jgi:putative PIN family toxin of toxin-antitoxin system
MRRIVIDTNVFIAALRSRRGASYRLLEMAGDARWEVNMSVALALEYEAIGKREANRLGISASAIDDIVDVLCKTSRHHAVHFRLRPELSDPDDEFVLELAFVARCDFIVTHNVRHLRVAKRFGIGVVTPGEFLRTMGVEP